MTEIEFYTLQALEMNGWFIRVYLWFINQKFPRINHFDTNPIKVR